MDYWSALCMDEALLLDLVELGGFDQEFQWLKLLALAAGTLGEVSLGISCDFKIRLICSQKPFTYKTILESQWP